LNSEIMDHINACSFQNSFPDQAPYTGISVNDVKSIAEKHDIPQCDVEIMALNHGIIPERYVRNMRSFSPEDQSVLLSRTVCIVGLGGLGGGVVEMLARMGVGKLILIDGDAFEESNLNRQLLSSEEKIGGMKALSAEKRVAEINSSIQTEAYAEFLTEKNAQGLMQKADLVIDCLDNLKTRFIVEKAAKGIGIPMVSGAVAGSTGQVTTIFPEDTGLAAIYGNPDQLPEKGIETSLGTLSYAVTLVATLECSEAVKILLKNGIVLRNKLFIIHPQDNLFEAMSLSE